jgi:hypothetical protein
VNAFTRHHQLQIDRALLALLDERARLAAAAGASVPAAVDDLLRRHTGVVGSQAIRQFFAAVERACEPAAASPERAP